MFVFQYNLFEQIISQGLNKIHLWQVFIQGWYMFVFFDLIIEKLLPIAYWQCDEDLDNA
jgi:hypothetical protein